MNQIDMDMLVHFHRNEWYTFTGKKWYAFKQNEQYAYERKRWYTLAGMGGTLSSGMGGTLWPESTPYDWIQQGERTKREWVACLEQSTRHNFALSE